MKIHFQFVAQTPDICSRFGCNRLVFFVGQCVVEPVELATGSLDEIKAVCEGHFPDGFRKRNDIGLGHNSSFGSGYEMPHGIQIVAKKIASAKELKQRFVTRRGRWDVVFMAHRCGGRITYRGSGQGQFDPLQVARLISKSFNLSCAKGICLYGLLTLPLAAKNRYWPLDLVGIAGAGA